ncbi:MAG: hypothetical protein GX613_13560 [Chloroflexi bacterium]|nr:hypothetical protein [Chloroflexota bacterium]
MNAAVFIATTGGGLGRAVRDKDGAWTVETLLPAVDVRSLAVDPHHSGVIFAGTQGRGLWRSPDRGATWQPFALDDRIIKSVAVSPAAPGLIVVGTKPPHVLISRDNGATWQALEAFRQIRSRRLWYSPAEPPGTAYVQGLALSPTDPNVIIAGVEAGATVASFDQGLTWTNHINGSIRDCHTLTFHATDGNWVYEGGGTGAGAAFSQNGGRTWQQVRDGMDRHYGWAVAADPAQPDLWYASMSPGPRKAHQSGHAEAHIYRTRGGAPWEKLGGGLPDPLMDMPYGLITDPHAPGHLYAGLRSGDLWFSADYGDHWEKLPVRLPSIETALIALFADTTTR